MEHTVLKSSLHSTTGCNTPLPPTDSDRQLSEGSSDPATGLLLRP